MLGGWIRSISPEQASAPRLGVGLPMWPDAGADVRRLVPAFAGRVIVTRWVAPIERIGSWATYMEA